jgi:predicted nucleic acid-binding protein
MRIVINDANILIDLVKIDLMNQFVQLDMELKTTDFVLEELNDEQKNIVKQFIEAGKIEIIVTEEVEDFVGIASVLENSSGLSFEDCSVWYYANKLDVILLSGDGRLRKLAIANGITVRGVLYVFDQLLLKELLTFEVAIEKIELLYKINSRLPIQSKNERIAHWVLKKHTL